MPERRIRIRIKLGRINITGTYNILAIVIMSFITLVLIKPFTIDAVMAKMYKNEVSIQQVFASGNTETVSAENSLKKSENASIQGVSVKPPGTLNSNVNTVDVRVRALQEVFKDYDSPLYENADDFVKYADKYEVKNWQLLPAIGLAETLGCTTGTTFYQKNCWGWGGADPTRVIFPDFETAIDSITRQMKDMYGNERLNAKDIQSTYCGMTCMEWGWRWARGVDYYTRKINDNAEKYGLERSNELQL